MQKCLGVIRLTSVRSSAEKRMQHLKALIKLFLQWTFRFLNSLRKWVRTVSTVLLLNAMCLSHPRAKQSKNIFTKYLSRWINTKINNYRMSLKRTVSLINTSIFYHGFVLVYLLNINPYAIFEWLLFNLFPLQKRKKPSRNALVTAYKTILNCNWFNKIFKKRIFKIKRRTDWSPCCTEKYESIFGCTGNCRDKGYNVW